MRYVDVALVMVGILSLFNLAFTAALARRIRRLGARWPAGMPVPDSRSLAPGTVVEPFEASTVDGASVSRDTLPDGALVAFLAPGCRPCEELLPALVERARAHPGGRGHVVVVLTAARPEEAAGYVARLRDAATVVVEDDRGPFSDAFRAIAFPVIYLVGAGGRVLAVGTGPTAVQALPTPVAAHAG